MGDRDLLARITAGPRFLLLGQGPERRKLADVRTGGAWFFPEEMSSDTATELPNLRTDDLAAYSLLIGDATLPEDLQSVTSRARRPSR